jgi:hypothetical protein
MPKAADSFAPISAPRIYTEISAPPAKHSDTSEFIGVALFSGVGLFVSLVAVIFGVQGNWF